MSEQEEALQYAAKLRTDAAKKTLVHYFRVLFEATGKQWESDIETEINGIVDDIQQGTMDHTHPGYLRR